MKNKIFNFDKISNKIVLNIITQLISIALGIISYILIVRSFGPEKYGIISFSLTLIYLIVNWGHFGILSGTNYFYCKPKNEKNINNISKYKIFQNNLTFALLITCFWIIFINIINLKFNIFNGLYELLNYNLFSLNFFYLLIPILLVSGICSGILFIQNKALIQNMILLFFEFFFILILSVFYLNNFLSIFNYITLFIIIEFFKLIFYFNYIKIPYKIYLNKILIKEEFKFGFNIFLSSCFIYLLYKVDIILIKYFLNFTDVGLYTVGTNIAEKLMFIPSSIGPIFLAYLLNNKHNDKNGKITLIITKISFFLSMIISILVFFISPYLINLLFGSTFNNSSIIVRILLLGVIFMIIGRILYYYFYAKGETKIHIIISFTAFIINLIFNMILIPIYGIYGAAFSSTISYIFFGLFYIIKFLKSEKKMKIYQFFTVNKIEIAIIKEFIHKKIQKLIIFKL